MESSAKSEIISNGEKLDFELTQKQDEALDVIADPQYRHVAGRGGSRSGKTFLFILCIIMRALKAKGSNHCILRYRANAAKKSIFLKTFPDVINTCFPDLKNKIKENKQDMYFTLPNGSRIWVGGLDDEKAAEKILGNEYSTIFLNECSEIPYESVLKARTRLAEKNNLVQKAYYDLNPPSKRHWSYVYFFGKKDPLEGNPHTDSTVTFQLNPVDNKINLSQEYLDEINSYPTLWRKRFYLGEYSDDDDKALWNESIFAQNRLLGRQDQPLPDLKRIVIAVDPSGCSGSDDTRSDQIGIGAVALGSDGVAYVLEDLTDHYSPAQWGKLACDRYVAHGADVVVGEKNFGGAMVEHTIRVYNDNVNYKEVTASRGKVQRAEPISALYSRGKVKHVGYYPELEAELCDFTVNGYQGAKSPNRADWVIWGLTELFPGIVKGEEKLPELRLASIAKSRAGRRKNWMSI